MPRKTSRNLRPEFKLWMIGSTPTGLRNTDGEDLELFLAVEPDTRQIMVARLMNVADREAVEDALALALRQQTDPVIVRPGDARKEFQRLELPPPAMPVFFHRYGDPGPSQSPTIERATAFLLDHLANATAEEFSAQLPDVLEAYRRQLGDAA